MKWEDKEQVKKGNIGEDAVERFLEEEGFVIYKPVTDVAHPFDRLCVKDKNTIFIAEIKTKPMRKYYPDTGFNYTHYEDYQRMQKKGLNVYMFFVDEIQGVIYGNTLNKISENCIVEHNGKMREYPKIEGSIIYFPIKNMEFINHLKESEINSIKELYTGSYEIHS